jgi:molecular chaperone IbpA
MRTIDVSPFYRTSIGFDRLFNLLDQVTSDAAAPSYPPYNIEKTGEDAYSITLAVAGFADDELDVEVRDQSLIVSGEKRANGEDGRTYLHRGIAARNFQRRFELADNVYVTGAAVENGLLTVTLDRRVPEELKARKIPIGADKPKVIEGQKAA